MPRCRLVMNRKRTESSTSLLLWVMFITEPYCFTALLAVAKTSERLNQVSVTVDRAHTGA